ncbi:YoaK family protein [Bradyrhizobium sp. SK17]|uniref:YoaK family protein n=1 Tax=Bradyrhizobium sp. SK17 TaxID=2057741 RepID=UPI0012FDEF9E|nr:YoaK family protein [Bradyrhizobium sp. SK17]
MIADDAGRATESVPPHEASLPAWVPGLLSFVAGYVDSFTFLALFGLFVANVTGSFVTAGAELVIHDIGIAGKMLAGLAFLVAAALAAGLIGTIRERGGAPLPWMLAVEAALLTVFSVLMLFGGPLGGASDWHGIVAGLFAAMAMGTQSVIVRLLMHGIPQTNVMTGNMTQLGIEITGLLLAWRRARAANDLETRKEFIVIRTQMLTVLATESGFMLGASCGAAAYAAVGLAGTPLAIVLVAGLAIGALWRKRTA